MNRYKGPLLMIFGIFLAVISDLSFKNIALPNYPFLQMVGIRAFMKMIPILGLIFYLGNIKDKFIAKQPIARLAHCIVNFSATLLFLYAYKILKLSDIYVLGYSEGIFIVYMGIFVLKEKVSLPKVIAMTFSVLGIIIALRPELTFNIGSVIVLLGAIIASTKKIIIRKYNKDHVLLMSLYPNVFMCICLLPFIIIGWEPIHMNHWLPLILGGASSGITQLCVYYAVKITPVSITTPLSYTSFLWITILELSFFGIMPSLYAIIGVCLIASGNIYMLIKEKHSIEKPVTSPSIASALASPLS